jgi:hypothetical protein
MTVPHNSSIIPHDYLAQQGIKQSVLPGIKIVRFRVLGIRATHKHNKSNEIIKNFISLIYASNHSGNPGEKDRTNVRLAQALVGKMRISSVIHELLTALYPVIPKCTGTSGSKMTMAFRYKSKLVAGNRQGL